MTDQPAAPITLEGRVAIVTGAGVPNRGALGAYPRMLGHFVRDEKLMPLERAVHQMTGLAADRLDLPDVGRIRPGAAADLVVLDFQTVADTSDYRRPVSAPVGIEHVFVNGVPAVGDHAVEKNAGRLYRRSR